ncbi:DUF1330 domain-containing protein [Gordonia rhizosphera]|uniref:DUF1330 domain-containing protein n=1 Tax=Gordonia rhizosphera TaxID=83341 RepID=UPI00058CF621|nr:DUF1330 domain-containing protein [Gordonia rhizosphera]
MSVTLAVLLWSVDDRESQLHHYEDDVLRLVAEHRGRVLTRVRNIDAADHPTETQVIEFTDQSAFDAYMTDPRRVAMAYRRDACVARTEVWRVDSV